MFNSGKHFLTGLLHHLGRGEQPVHSGRKQHRLFRRNAVSEHLKPRSLQMETLEDRQLLAVTAMEKSQIAAAYADFGVSANDNFIEITNNNLTAQQLVNAISQARYTNANDVIVLRTTDTHFTVDLGSSTINVDVNSAVYGSVTIIGHGTAPLRLTSDNETAIYLLSGNLNLGNMEVVGTKIGTSNTAFDVVKSAPGTVLQEQDVTLTTRSAWTVNIPNRGTAYYSLVNGVYSVDFPTTVPGDATATYRSYITGLTSVAQVNYVLSNVYTTGTNSAGDALNYYQHKDFIDANISKTSNYDSNHGWAGAAADMLAYTGWGNKVSTNPDDLLRYFSQNFNNNKYYVEGGLEWFMNGTTHTYPETHGDILDADDNVIVPATNDVWAAVTGTGGNIYGPNYLFQRYGGTFYSGNYYNSMYFASPMVAVSEMLDAGYAVSTNLNSLITTNVKSESYVYVNGALQSVTETENNTTQDYRYATGAMMIYGYVYDTSKTEGAIDYYTHVYMADPTDGTGSVGDIGKLQLYAMTWETDGAGRMINSYQLVAGGHTITSEQKWVYGTPTSSGTPPVVTQTNVATTTRVDTVSRMGSFVYLVMAPGHGTVEQDPYEPNENATQVDGYPVSKLTALTPNLGIIDGKLTIEHLNIADNDGEDWFKFQTVFPCSISDAITIDYYQTLFSGGVKFYLYTRDNNGKLVLLEDYNFKKELVNTTDAEGVDDLYRLTMSLGGLVPGTYYLRIYRADANVDCNDYTLTFTTNSDDRYEVNNTRQDVDKATVGNPDSPNFGPVMVSEMVISDLVLRQASPSAFQTSEVDAFCFVMTGYGGINSYIEIQYLDTNPNSQSPYDAELDLFLYRREADSYYLQYPTAWASSANTKTGTTVKDELGKTIPGVKRISLDGLGPGTYYIKIAGLINSENLLHYKLIIHLRDETDPPGIGVTTLPDYYVDTPANWRTPLVVTKEQWALWDPEKSRDPLFSTGGSFYTQDKIYVNYSFSASENAPVGQTVRVGLTINGWLLNVDIGTDISGGGTIKVTDKLIAELTESVFLTINSGNFYLRGDGTPWSNILEDGMVISVLNDHNFIETGYVYNNGKFIAITPTTDLVKSGDLLLFEDSTGAYTREARYYKQTVMLGTKTYTDVFVNSAASGEIRYNANNVNSMTAIPMTLLTATGSLELVYNATLNRFTLNGGNYAVPVGSILTIPEPVKGSTVKVQARYAGSNLFQRAYFDIDAFGLEVVSGVEYSVSPSKPLVAADGSTYYYRSFGSGATGFYRIASAAADYAMGDVFTLADGTEVTYRGVYSGTGSDPNGLYQRTLIGQGMFLTEYTAYSGGILYYGGTADNNRVVFDSTSGTFKRYGTTTTVNVPANSVLKTSANADGNINVLFQNAKLWISYEQAIAVMDDTPLEKNLFLVTTSQHKNLVVEYRGNGVFFDANNPTVPVTFTGTATLFDYTNGCYYSFNSATGFTQLINTIPNGTITRKGDNKSFQYEDSRLYVAVANFVAGTRFTYNSGTYAETTLEYAGGKFYQVTTPVTTFEYMGTGGARYLMTWDNGSFFDCKTANTTGEQAFNFADGTQFLFYQEKDGVNSPGTSYIKVTPASVTHAQAAYYMNTISFEIDPYNEIPEYLKTNNSFEVSFAMARYQDDQFVPNATKLELETTTNTDQYHPSGTHDPNAKYNPNLGPVSGNFVVDGLALMTQADWFSFEVLNKTTGGDYGVKIDFESKFGDLDLYIYKADADYPSGYRLFGYSAGIGNSEFVSLATGGTGLYYIQVIGYRGVTNPYYKLTIDAPPPVDPSNISLDATHTVINSSALISWNKQGAAPDYVFGGADEFFLYTEVVVRDKSGNVVSQGQAKRGITNWTVTGLLPKSDYTYTVVAYNSIGQKTITANGNFTTDDFLADTKYYGLVIGVDGYANHPTYSAAKTDAIGVYNALIQAPPQWWVNTSTDTNITLLTGNVTKQAIADALYQISLKAQSNDVVFIYYAGLGTTKEVAGETTAYLTTYNNAIGADELSAMIGILDVGQVQLILNPYFTDSSATNPVIYDYEGFGYKLVEQYQGTQTQVSVITSAQTGENTLADHKGNDIFGQALISALTLKVKVNGEEYYVADLQGNRDHRLSFEEIYDYVYNEISQQSLYQQTPRLIPNDAADSIVIKGNWKEIDTTTGYNYFNNTWWNANAIVVTTKADVVDATDGIISLREAISWLGTTLTRDTRLADGTEYRDAGGTLRSFNYQAKTLNPNDKFTINSVDYTYRDGLYYTVSGQNTLMESGSSFLYQGKSYTYRNVNGSVAVYDELNMLVPNFFVNRTSAVTVTIGGSSVTLRQTGVAIESRVMNTITFSDVLIGSDFVLREELVIDSSKFKGTGAITSIVIDASILSGSSAFRAAPGKRHLSVAGNVTQPVAMVGFVFIGGSSDDGAAIKNAGDLWLLNTLIYGNEAGDAGTIANYGTLNVVNSTIAGNYSAPTATGYAGIANKTGATLNVVNSILYGNERGDIANTGGTVNVNYSLVSVGHDWTIGTKNIDPSTVSLLFRDADNYDFHIVKGSPVINAADPAQAQRPDGKRLDYDLDGNSRMLYGGVDMGAYEWVDPTLKLSTTVTTIGEDNVIDERISLREAISYVGTTYSTDDQLVDVEGTDFRLNGSVVYAEKGQFYTHQSGYYFTLASGSKVQLAVGDLITDYTTNITYRFTGNGFVNHSTGVAVAAPSLVNELVFSRTGQNAVTGHYSNYASVLFTDYQSGDTITYRSDNSTGIVRKNADGSLTIRKTVTLSNTIQFNIDAIKADFLKTGTIIQWNAMIATYGLIFALETGNYPGAISIYSSLNLNVTSVNVTGGTTAEKAAILTNGITIVPNTGSVNRVFNIEAAATDNVHFQNVRLIGNGQTVVFDGGAIYLYSGNLTISAVTIAGFKTTGAGGAIYVAGGANLNLTNQTKITGNLSAQNGGAVYVATSGLMTMSGSEISGNTATLNGGAVYVDSVGGFAGSVTLSGNNTISGNSSLIHGGAIYNRGTFVITGSATSYTIISGNTAGVSGGGIYNSGSFTANRLVTYTGYGMPVVGNTANAGSGGFAFNTATGNMTFNYSKICYNDAFGNGGGLANYGGLLLYASDVSGNTISNITATASKGAGIYDGAVSVGANGYSTSIINSVISGNGPKTAGIDNVIGGAVFAEYGASLYLLYSTVVGNLSTNATYNGIVLGSNTSLYLQSSVVALHQTTPLSSGNDIAEYAGATGVSITSRYSFVGLTPSTVGWMIAGDISLINPADRDPGFTNCTITNLLTDYLNWDKWDLVPGLNSQLIEKAEPGVLTYKSLAGGIITIIYDKTGHRKRVLDNMPDIGAYEAGVQTEDKSLVVTTWLDVIDPSDNETSLREAILYAIDLYLNDGMMMTITFDADVFSIARTIGLNWQLYGSFVFGEGAVFVIDASSVNVAGQEPTITLSGQNNITPIIVADGANVEIRGVIIADGYAQFDPLEPNNLVVARGGAVRLFGGTLMLTNSIIRSNEADDVGGAFYQMAGNLILTQCLVYNNRACQSIIPGSLDRGGGAIRSTGGRLSILSSTISRNQAPLYGGVYATDTAVSIYNSILGENTDGIGFNVDLYTRNLYDIFNCFIGQMYNGQVINRVNGNIVGTTADPKDPGFVNSGAGDFRLQGDSPAINTGNRLYAKYPNGAEIVTDIAGNTRQTQIDMGVYESDRIDPSSTVVTTLLDVIADDGLVSIREAIANAKNLGTPITFDIRPEETGEMRIILNQTLGTLVIDSDLTINAANIPGGIIIDAKGEYGIMTITGNANVNLTSIVLTGGVALGGAISVDSSAEGTVRLTNCVIVNNSSTGYAGAIYLGSALSKLALLNCTVAGNVSNDYGAIYGVAGSQMTIYNSIIADNLNDVGGATQNYDIHSGSNAANSILVVTSLVGALDPAWVTRGSVVASIYGTTTQSASPSFTTAPEFSGGRVINADQISLTLRQRSQAINTGNNTFVGMPGYLSNLPEGYRADTNAVVPYDLAGEDRIAYYIVDMGAYEYQSDTPIKVPSIVVTTLDDTVDPFGTGISLREAIIYAGTSFILPDGTSITLGTEITFDKSLAGGTISLSEALGTLNINKSVSISAAGLHGGITIDAGGKFRAITVGGGDIDVVLEYFTITGGNAGTEGGGGIYHVSGNLTVVNSLIYNNNAARGGAIYSIADPRFSAATISLVNCTITKNNAYSESNDIISGYGGVYALRSQVRFYNTLVALNTTGYNFSNPPVNCPYTYADLLAKGYFLVDNLVANATYESSLIGIMATWLSIDGDSHGNIAGTPLNPLNPHFINWDSDNFNLGKYASSTDGSIMLNSPAINAGQNAFAVDHLGNPLSYDLAGTIRFVEKVDIGAFESYNGSSEIPSIIVTTLDDIVDQFDGQISLREALMYAGTNGLKTTITFMKALSGGTLYLNSALYIDKDITIDGASLGTMLTLSTNLNVTTLTERIIYINSGSVTLIGLTVSNFITERLKQGQVPGIAQGGAIYQRTGSLTLYNCVVADNMAGSAGAIFVEDGLTTITNIVNCTITNNRAGDAAIVAGQGRINIKNSVLARNRTDVNNTDIIGQNLEPENSFIAYAPSVKPSHQTGLHGNYIGNTAVSLKNEAENYLFIDWANGNYRLKDTSLAINSGENVYSLRNNNGQIIFNGMINFSEVDSLGKKRLVGQTIDMGAFENQIATDNYNWVDADLVTVTTNRDTSNAGDGLISLREAVARAERLYDLGIVKPITFSQYYLGMNPRMVLVGQAIVISRPITINPNYEGTGLGEKLRVNSFHIDGDNLNNIFLVQVDVTKLKAGLIQDVTIYNLELSNGMASGGGAIYHASGNLVLLNVLIHSNVAKFIQPGSKSYGGGIYSAGNLTLVNCTIANNTADFGAGIYMAKGSTLTMYNTVVAKNLLNGATTTSDVDLAFEQLPAQITSLEVRNSLIGRAYSLRTLNNVNSNLVGHGSDYAVDPYFISIGRNNYRLQPRVNGEVNLARELGSYRFTQQYNLRFDLDGNYITPLQNSSDAQAELNYFNNYIASLSGNTPYWTNGLLTQLNNDIAQGRRGDLVSYDCRKYWSKGGNTNSTDDFLVYYTDEIQLADDTLDMYNTYLADNPGSDNLYMFMMWIYSNIDWDNPDPRHMLILELVNYPGQFGRLYADLQINTLSQLGVALRQYRNDRVTSQNIAFPGGNPLAPTFWGIYTLTDNWGTTGYTAKNLKNRIEGKFSKLVISNVVQTNLVIADIQADIAGKISIGTYQPTREARSTIVTTLEDIVDPFDGVVSLREALTYYSGNNRYYSIDPLSGAGNSVGYGGVGGAYNSSVSLSEFYSNANLLINRSPVTFVADLAGGTIVLNSPILLSNNSLNLVRFYYLDASLLSADGGILIDASNCDYAFQLLGAADYVNNWVAVTYAEFEGVTITGARVAAIDVDAFSVVEVRNSLLYRNETGIIVRDDSLPELFRYYGVAHILNTTIANNYYGIDNYGQVELYNSVVSLNLQRGVGGVNQGGDDLVIRSHRNAGYRKYDVAHSLVGTSFVYSQDGTGNYNFNFQAGVIRLSDALFVDEANDDYHLAAFSWGINTGSASYLAKNRPTHANAQTDMNGGARTQCGLVDIGCYENPDIWKVPGTTVTTNIDKIDLTGVAARNEISLREAIKYAEQFQYLYYQSTIPVTRMVTFDQTMSGKTIELTGGVINLVNDLVIDGRTLAQRVTINAMGQSGIFRIDSANTKYLNTIEASKLNISLMGLNLTGGYTTDGGAVYIASGNVLIQDSDIYGNRASGHGGAIYIYRNELTLRGVNIGGNIAAHYGGVVSNQGKVLMENTFLAENRATTPGSDYDFYFMTIGNTNGYGSKNSVFGKTRNIDLIGHGAPPVGDTNWIAEKDNQAWDNFDINSVFAGSWVNDLWVGTLARTFTPPTASPSALPEIFANFGDENDDLLTGLDLVL